MAKANVVGEQVWRRQIDDSAVRIHKARLVLISADYSIAIAEYRLSKVVARCAARRAA